MKPRYWIPGVLAWLWAAANAAEWNVDPAAAPGGDGSAAKPFASLAELVAALPKGPAEPLTVKLVPGTYRIDAPVELTPAHTRGKPLIIDGAGKAVISGGKRLTAWKVEGKHWTHEWNDGAIRELFVDGKRCPRACFPAEGWLRIDKALPDRRSGFTTQEDLPKVGPGAELLFLHDWSISRVPVASIEGRVLKTTGPIGFPAAHFVIDHYEPHPRYRLENDPAFLTHPGTWCHDPANKRLVYLPRDGEAPAATVLETPAASKLLRVAGKPGDPVRDVVFRGVSFELCRWDVSPSGYAEGQATKHVPRDAPRASGDPHGQWQFVPWAVEVEFAERVAFAKCGFRKLGGGGVWLGSATTACALETCRIEDVSGNGVGIGEGAERHVDGNRVWWQAAPEQVATGNRIEKSVVERCGAQFHGAVGIWVGLAKDTLVAGNEVRNLPYTGVSVGWMWNPQPTPCGGNRVIGNHIHHVMQLLSDGGGIYTLGRQPGTILADNLIHDVPLNAGRAESNGMFLDEGSSEFVIENNLIHGTDRSPLRFHRALKITVRGNRWILPTATPPLRFNSTDPASITASDNPVLDPASLRAAVDDWLAKHPAPLAP